MEHLVRFRSLWTKLTREDKLNVLDQNMNTVEKMIFSKYLHEFKSKNATSIDTDWNQMISKIIQNRQNRDSNLETVQNSIQSQTKAKTLGDLSQHLVQYIASFLEIESYARFECCDRFIFIAVRNTPTLQEIEELPRKMSDYVKLLSAQQTTVFFERFARVECMFLEDPMLLIPNIKWTYVTHMRLNWSDWEDEQINDLERFLLSNPFDASIIKQLTLMANGARVPALGIMHLLQQCDFLWILTIEIFLNDWKLYHMENVLKVQSFANLKHLTINCTPFMDPLVQRLSDQLVTLQISIGNDYRLPALLNSHVKFSNLRHFGVGYKCHEELINILRHTKIDHLSLNYNGCFRSDIDNELKELYQLILSKKDLIYLNLWRVDIRTAWSRIARVIEFLLRPKYWNADKPKYTLSHGLLCNLQLEDTLFRDRLRGLGPNERTGTDIFCSEYDAFHGSLDGWTQSNFKIVMDFMTPDFIPEGEWNIHQLRTFFGLEQTGDVNHIYVKTSNYTDHSCGLRYCGVVNK
eukprot:3584_1